MFTAIYLYRFIENGKPMLYAFFIGAAVFLLALLFTKQGRTKKGFLRGLCGLAVAALPTDVAWHLLYIEFMEGYDSADMVFHLFPGVLFWPFFLFLIFLFVKIINEMFAK